MAGLTAQLVLAPLLNSVTSILWSHSLDRLEKLPPARIHDHQYYCTHLEDRRLVRRQKAKGKFAGIAIIRKQI